MTKEEIITEIANQHVIEDIIGNVDKSVIPKQSLKDLAQDIYLDLLTKPEDKIIQLYKKKQLKYFISRMVVNNLHSNTSPYYRTYRRTTQINPVTEDMLIQPSFLD